MFGSNYPGASYPGQGFAGDQGSTEVVASIAVVAAAAGCAIEVVATSGTQPETAILYDDFPRPVVRRRRRKAVPLVERTPPMVAARIALHAAGPQLQARIGVTPAEIAASVRMRAGAPVLRMAGELDLTVLEEDELLLAGVF